MLILFTVPLWVGLIILFIKLVAGPPRVRLVERTVTAPDGSKTGTFLVPWDEPPHVSVARLYVQDAQPLVRQSAPESAADRQEVIRRGHRNLVIFVITMIVGVVIVTMAVHN
jgi:hypothetical protein